MNPTVTKRVRARDGELLSRFRDRSLNHCHFPLQTILMLWTRDFELERRGVKTEYVVGKMLRGSVMVYEVKRIGGDVVRVV